MSRRLPTIVTTIYLVVVKDLLAGDGVVVALLDIAFVVNKTGKRVSEVDGSLVGLSAWR